MIGVLFIFVFADVTTLLGNCIQNRSGQCFVCVLRNESNERAPVQPSACPGSINVLDELDSSDGEDSRI